MLLDAAPEPPSVSKGQFDSSEPSLHNSRLARWLVSEPTAVVSSKSCGPRSPSSVAAADFAALHLPSYAQELGCQVLLPRGFKTDSPAVPAIRPSVTWSVEQRWA